MDIPNSRGKVNYSQCQSHLAKTNVFRLNILIPLMKIVDAYLSRNHGCSVDEFCIFLFTHKGTDQHPNEESIKILIQDLKSTEVPDISVQYIVVDLFMHIIRFYGLLKMVSDDYFTQRRFKKNNLCETIVLIYILVFRISTLITVDSIDFFLHLTLGKMLSVVSYILREETNDLFYTIGCTIFDQDFVQEKIMIPLAKAYPSLKILRAYLINLKHQKKQSLKKQNTVPLSLNVLNRPKKLPPAPPPTPEEFVKETFARKVPKSTYVLPTIEEKLASFRNLNKLHAQVLLNTANKNAPSCLQRQKFRRIIHEDTQESGKQKIARKPPPIFKAVSIKPTSATILRECARITNDEVREIKKLKELCEGAFDPDFIIKLEDEERRKEQEMNLQKIKEKHLIALIAREGAYLAKRSFLDNAKINGENVRKEKKVLYQKLEEWREKYNKEMMEIVERCRRIEQASKEAYRSMLDEKRQRAAEVYKESQHLKETISKQKEDEARKKIQLIRDIKALQSLRGTSAKEFVRTEPTGLGLLCEMSLGELKERLHSMKSKLNEEIESRRTFIQEARNRQKDRIKCCLERINEYKSNRRIIQPNIAVGERMLSVSNSPEIEMLRKELEKRKAIRKEK